MKKLFAFVCAAALCTALFADDIFTFVPVKGKVSKCTQTDYLITSKFGNYYRTPNKKTIHIYDDFGNETSVTESTTKDELLSKLVNTYNSSNQLTEQAAHDSDDNIIWKDVITYKNNLKADKSEYNKNGDLKSKTIYQYTDGLLTDETDYNADGALMWKTIYTYTDGIVNVISKYNSKGELDTAETYKYNEDGKLDTIVTTDAFSNETTQIVFRYANGQISELLSYNSANKLVNRVLVKYDAAGNVAKISEYEVADKFGTTVNELINMIEYVFEY